MFKILIVDDEEDNLSTLKKIINTAYKKCKIFCLSEGKKTVEYVIKEKINLILLDINMPDMDGFEVAKKLKSNKKTKKIPIIFVTGVYKSEEFIEKGFNIGAIDYISKPIDTNRLFYKLRLYFKIIDKERKLRRSKKKYHNLFKNMLNGFAYQKIILDENNNAVDYKFLEVNHTFEKVMNLTKSEILGKRITEIFPDIHKSNLIKIYGRVALKNKEIRYKKYIKSLDKWFNVYSYCPRKGYIATIYEDITKQKRNEIALKEEKEQFMSIMEGLNAGINIIDLETCELLYLNKMSRTIFGNDYKGKKCYQVLMGRDKICDGCRNKELLLKTETVTVTEGKNPITNQYHMVTDKSIKWAGGKLVKFELFIDITSRKLAEQALMKSEEKFRTIFEESPIAITLLNSNGDMININKSGIKVLGYKEPKKVKTYYNLFSDPKIPNEIKEKIKIGKTARFGQIIDYEELKKKSPYTINREGKVYLDVSITPLFTDLTKQKITGYLLQTLDFTERRKSEKLVRRSQLRYKAIVEDQTEFIYRRKTDDTLTFVNEAYCRYINKTKDEVLGTKFQLEILRRDKEKIEQIKKKLSPDNPAFTLDIRVKFSGNEIKWNRWTSRAIFNEDKKIIEYQSVGRDITEQKIAENALKESEEKYRILFNMGNDLIFVNRLYKNGNVGKFIEVNDIACKMLGYTREKLLQIQPIDIIDKEYLPTEYTGEDIIIDLLNNKYSLFDWSLISKSGKKILCEINSHMFEFKDELLVLSILRDITDRKLSERKLKEAMEDLEHTNKELKQFVYFVSHDLKSPLTVIISYIRIIEKSYIDKLDDKAMELTSRVMKRAEKMIAMIDSLLSYSKIAGHWKNFKTCDCEITFQNALENLEIEIIQSQAEITHDKLPKVMGDEAQLISVFQNLIANSIKFCQDRIPKIHISAKEENNKWLFSIKDNGLGIEEEDKEKIFIIFYQLHDPSTYPGSGIGLAFCKKIIESHGGKIWVESTPEGGSIFYFTLNTSKK